MDCTRTSRKPLTLGFSRIPMGRSASVLYNPAIHATHSPDTGMTDCAGAWWFPGMTRGMGDVRKIWHDTSHIIDMQTRRELTKQMMAQYSEMHQTITAPPASRPQSAASGRSCSAPRRKEKPKAARRSAVQPYAIKRPFEPEIEFGILSVEHRTKHIFADRLMGLAKAW
eukprot:symbB.v1.2.009889.t1/scaffold639.1/size181572/10